MQLRDTCNITFFLKVVKIRRPGIWLNGQSLSHANLTIWVQIPRAHVKTRHSDVQVHNAFLCASVRGWNVDTWEMPEACNPAYTVVNKETLSQTRCKMRTSNLNFAQISIHTPLVYPYTDTHMNIDKYTHIQEYL